MTIIARMIEGTTIAFITMCLTKGTLFEFYKFQIQLYKVCVD